MQSRGRVRNRSVTKRRNQHTELEKLALRTQAVGLEMLSTHHQSILFNYYGERQGSGGASGVILMNIPFHT